MLRAMKRYQRRIDRVLGPAVRRGTERLAHFGTALSGADSDHHLLANRVFFRRFSVPGGLERLLGAIARALDDRFPSGGVGFFEAREKAH
jgi:hypothetical protein